MFMQGIPLVRLAAKAGHAGIVASLMSHGAKEVNFVNDLLLSTISG